MVRNSEAKSSLENQQAAIEIISLPERLDFIERDGHPVADDGMERDLIFSEEDDSGRLNETIDDQTLHRVVFFGGEFPLQGSNLFTHDAIGDPRSESDQHEEEAEEGIGADAEIKSDSEKNWSHEKDGHKDRERCGFPQPLVENGSRRVHEELSLDDSSVSSRLKGYGKGNESAAREGGAWRITDRESGADISDRFIFGCDGWFSRPIQPPPAREG